MSVERGGLCMIFFFGLVVMCRTTMSDESERTCPLCTEPMDLTDQQLKPCKCGYEMCVWCWNQIIELAEKDETEGRCPACRTPYDKERIVGAAVNCERMVTELSSEKKTKPQKAKLKSSEGRKNLINARVIQHNLVYVIGIPVELADENILEKKEFFGQYGKVLKVSVTRPTGSVQQSSSNGTCSIYVTYGKEEEAFRCIQSVHGFTLEGRPLRACFGTTKYCHTWLRNMHCNNPDCLYLHEVGAQADSFTKDEIVSAYNRVQQLTGIALTSQRRAGNILPPPMDDSYGSTTATPSRTALKSGLNNPSVPGKSSPPNSSYGRCANLPAGASWGTRVTTSNMQVNNGVSQGVIKPASSPAFSAVASSTSSVSVNPINSTKGAVINDRRQVLSNDDVSILQPSKQPTQWDFQTVEETDTMFIPSNSDLSVKISPDAISSSSISAVNRNPDSGIISRQKSGINPDLEAVALNFTSLPGRSNVASGNGETQKSVHASPPLFTAFENGKHDVLFSSRSSDFGDSGDRCLEDVESGFKNNSDLSRMAVCIGSLHSEASKATCQAEIANVFTQGTNSHDLGNAEGALEVDSNFGPDAENNIISSILSLELDSWDDPLTSSNGFSKILSDSDNGTGSFGFPSSRKTERNSSQSRFSFAREDDFFSSPTYSEPSFGNNCVNIQNLSVQPEGLDKGSIYGNKYQNGFHPGFQELGDNPVFQSTNSPVARPQISAPPGFSAPSRAPPPGFFPQDRQNRSIDLPLANQTHDILPLRRDFQMDNGNMGNISDVEFIDPAILAVGKGKLPVGLMNSNVDIPSSYSPLISSAENDIRLRMLMQQESATHPNFRYGDLTNRIAPAPSYDGYFHSRFDGSNLSNFGQPPLHQSRNPHFSNGRWDGWNEGQARNEFGGVNELLRNDRPGVNNFVPGFDGRKFQMPSSGDVYNRAFGM